MKNLLLILCFCFPLGGFAQNAGLYKIYDVQQHKVIGMANLVQDAKNTDVIFFGEEHNDSVGHSIENELLKSLYAVYPKVQLSMEMLYTDVQPVIDEYLGGYISEKNFIKEARVWNNYNDYKPLLEFAKANKIPVTGANAAARYSNMVTKSGLDILKTLPKLSRSFLPPLPIDTATGVYYSKFIETLGGHEMGNMKIYQTQNLWDATMAWSVAKSLKKNRGAKILQINGRFHSDEKLGALAKLKQIMPRIRISNISCFPAQDFKNPDWDKYKHLGDYIIITSPDVQKTY